MRSAVLIYGIFAGYVFFKADSMIFLPPEASYSDTSDILKLRTAGDRQISALLLIPSEESTPNPSTFDPSISEQFPIEALEIPSEMSPDVFFEMPYVLLYSHGNAEDLGLIRPVLDILTETGAAVFAYDYQGYGTSEGRATEQGAYADIDAAYAYLTKDLAIAPERIIIHGRSVGGGPSVALAAREPVGGLILESAFISAFRTVVPFPILPFDKFHNLSKLKDVDSPVLVIHGTEDRTIPFWHGETLFEHAPEPKQFFWVEGAGHNDLVWVAGDRYVTAIQDFIEQVDTNTIP